MARNEPAGEGESDEDLQSPYDLIRKLRGFLNLKEDSGLDKQFRCGFIFNNFNQLKVIFRDYAL